jgi:diacylglycerol O-acyltransferase / wax synthase
VQAMSVQDAMFLHVENDVTPMHIGGVSIFEGPPPPFSELRSMVEGKLDLTPRYRQKVRFVPLGMGEPVWVDDPHFNIDYHLRHSAVPSPGKEEQLRATAARVFSQHLDRSKPLWEIWMVEGLEGDRWALLSKVHHCMVDGVAATDMMSLMFGDSPEPGNGDGWHADPEPSDLDLIAYSARHRVRDPAAQIRFALRAPSEVLRAFAGGAKALLAAAPALRPSTSSLTGPIGPHRVWSWANVSLADVKEVRSKLGGTVNDVVLTLITNGYRGLLEHRRASAANTTTASRRSSRACRWAWRTRPSAWRTSGRRWTGSSPPSRRSRATRSRSSPGSRRPCCSRSAAGWRPAQLASTWTPRPPTSRDPRLPSTPSIGSCSPRTRTYRWWARSGSW